MSTRPAVPTSCRHLSCVRGVSTGARTCWPSMSKGQLMIGDLVKKPSHPAARHHADGMSFRPFWCFAGCFYCSAPCCLSVGVHVSAGQGCFHSKTTTIFSQVVVQLASAQPQMGFFTCVSLLTRCKWPLKY